MANSSIPPPSAGAPMYRDDTSTCRSSGSRGVMRTVPSHAVRRGRGPVGRAGAYIGRTGLFEVCDASPYLSRAAKYHGEATDVACPVCRKDRLTLVNYVYGDHLGPISGQAKTGVELARMDAMQEEFTVYAVEVCRSCGWNHLDSSYVLGAEPVPGRAPRRTRRRVATE